MSDVIVKYKQVKGICFHAFFFPGKFVPSIVICTFVATESATLPI